MSSELVWQRSTCDDCVARGDRCNVCETIQLERVGGCRRKKLSWRRRQRHGRRESAARRSRRCASTPDSSSTARSHGSGTTKTGATSSAPRPSHPASQGVCVPSHPLAYRQRPRAIEVAVPLHNEVPHLQLTFVRHTARWSVDMAFKNHALHAVPGPG
jgi:hypothetical protein